MNSLIIDVEGARYQITMEQVGPHVAAEAHPTTAPVTEISTLTVDELAAVIELIEDLEPRLE